MNGRTDKIRRLILVLQSILLIPPIVVVLVNWVYQKDRIDEIIIYVLLSFIPFTLLILGKFIVQGKFYIFKEKVDEQ
jgi:hypothetical protein